MISGLKIFNEIDDLVDNTKWEDDNNIPEPLRLKSLIVDKLKVTKSKYIASYKDLTQLIEDLNNSSATNLTKAYYPGKFIESSHEIWSVSKEATEEEFTIEFNLSDKEISLGTFLEMNFTIDGHSKYWDYTISIYDKYNNKLNENDKLYISRDNFPCRIIIEGKKAITSSVENAKFTAQCINKTFEKEKVIF